MAKHEVAQSKIGSYANSLTSSTVDEVAFADVLQAVEVYANGLLYFTVDGSTPTVGGANTYQIPSVGGVRTVLVPKLSVTTPTVVKLISAGTPEYSVARTTV